MLLRTGYNRPVPANLLTDLTSHTLIGIDRDSSFPLVPIFGLARNLAPAYGGAIDLETHFTSTTVISGDDVDRAL